MIRRECVSHSAGSIQRLSSTVSQIQKEAKDDRDMFHAQMAELVREHKAATNSVMVKFQVLDEERKSEQIRTVMRELFRYVDPRIRASVGDELKGKFVKYVKLCQGVAVLGDEEYDRKGGKRREERKLDLHGPLKEIRTFARKAGFTMNAFDTAARTTIQDRNVWAHTVPSSFDVLDEFKRTAADVASTTPYQGGDNVFTHADHILTFALHLYESHKHRPATCISDMIGRHVFRF